MRNRHSLLEMHGAVMAWGMDPASSVHQKALFPPQGQHMSPRKLDLQAVAKRMAGIAGILLTMAQKEGFREPPTDSGFSLCRHKLFLPWL